ncbi:HNRNPUL1 [Lepeophtheirus salmonis]|uniref:HNRNPUL1 n=1 Tax=Lepeophtheirus salmonis TaxID=72036 RepID=A0A7R8CP32_LEPSM|nr:HNRNPUL1 [Lepeophtheirus salmonis]CAF2881608.1 HNRNPUL1 [Lepeophtheirus salmonis]
MGYVWAGVKATHGFNEGKIGFQVKLIDNMDSKLEDEKDLHELRLGFSTNEPSMQLGESKNSFSYGGSGKKGTDCTFEDYGEKFVKGDVIGAYLDLTSDDVKITFTKNETTLDEAFSFPKSQLEGKTLFPHISSRNVKFEVNFGKNLDETPKEPWFPLLAEYEFPSNAKDSERGPARIATREECEMIMMIGLPGSDTMFIGTTSLIDKMKVNGVCRRTSHTGRRDVLIQKCTRCLQDWLRLASQRRRNIIIDQRKVRPFEGMIRKAVVMVPSDEEYKVRAEAQEKAESKDVPDTAVMEMKANFSLPREEAQKLIEEYNKDAKEKGFGKKVENKAKRARGNNFRRGRSMMRNRRGGRNFGARGGSGFRGGPSNGRMFMRGNNFRRGGGGPHAPPPPPMRGFMHPRGPMQYNRGNRNQVKFGKNGRSNWGGQDSAPWSQWQQPNRPTGWGHWNQGNQNHQNHQNHHQQSWGGSQGNNRNHQPLNHQGFSSGGNGGGNHVWWWRTWPLEFEFLRGWECGWNSSNSSSSGWNQGGNSKWSNNSNQGYPGNSYWGGGGGYGGR